jgi:hypothetical protein
LFGSLETPFRVIALHVHEHADDSIVVTIQLSSFRVFEVAALDGKLQPHLSLGSLGFGIR